MSAFDRETRPAPGKPHGWVQWKGTNVCMDVHCECGCHSHIDDEFVYNVKCPKCGRVYHVNGHVELVLLTEAEVKEENPHVIKEPQDSDDL
jgi:hypothetical protein